MCQRAFSHLFLSLSDDVTVALRSPPTPERGAILGAIDGKDENECQFVAGKREQKAEAAGVERQRIRPQRHTTVPTKGLSAFLDRMIFIQYRDTNPRSVFMSPSGQIARAIPIDALQRHRGRPSRGLVGASMALDH